MSKFIIKNCPMYFAGNCYGHTGNCDCLDCTSCVMKQIVEECRAAQKEYPKKISDGEMDMFVSGRNNLAGIILALFAIQEVE